MEKIIVSVIVPVYNAEAYLRTTIDSILGQTFKSFELILVDDGSSDKSGVICDEYAIADERVIVIHKQNGGVSDARNLGIEHARGEFIEFVDNDDYVFPDFLQTMVEEIGKYDLLQSTPLSGTRHNIKLCNRALLDNSKTISCIKGENGAVMFPQIDESNMATIWNQLYKKTLIDKGHIRFRHIQSEDELFSYEYMSHANSIKKINYQGYYFINNSDSQGSKHNYIAELDYIQLMENIYLRILQTWSIKDKYYIQKIKVRIAVRLVHYLLKGYFTDTKVFRSERIQRWQYVNKDSFTNWKVMFELNSKEKFIYIIAKLKLYKIFDTVLAKFIK